MAERDILTLIQKELKLLHSVHKVLEDVITRAQSAACLEATLRQTDQIRGG